VPVPAVRDLREAGWRLVGTGLPPEEADSAIILAEPGCLSLTDRDKLRTAPLALRQTTLALGVDDAAQRLSWLRLGLGDVLGTAVGLPELALRAARVARIADQLPRWRTAGPLTLDLLDRDARLESRRIWLHPREFALLWRLAEVPGHWVSQAALRRDLWSQSFRPETNSLAVHVCRLRTRLRDCGAGELIETARDGAYRLRAPPAAFNFQTGQLLLDDHVRLRDEAAGQERDADHEAGIQNQ
jgi:two-component system, OmpR family, response regulator